MSAVLLDYDQTIGSQVPSQQLVPDSIANLGEEIIGFSAEHGLYLDPWQELSVTNASGIIERRGKRRWAAFEVLEIVPRQNGKGSILEARELYGLYKIRTDRLILHTAHEHKTSAEHYLRLKTLIYNSDYLAKQVVRNYSAYGREFIEIAAPKTIITSSGAKGITRGQSSRIMFIARSSGSGRGFTGDLIVYDECMILDAGKVSASMPSVRARPNPQIWYTGSAGMPNSTQMARVRRRGLDIDRKSKFLCFMEWAANIHHEYCPPTCTEHVDRNSMDAILQSNPGFGIRIDEEMIERERDAFEGDDEGYDREILGVGTYPVDDDAWAVIPEKRWWATADPTDGSMLRRITFGVDVTPNRDHAAISVCGVRADGKRVTLVIKHGAGTAWLVNAIKEINEERGKRAKWIIDPHSGAGSFIDELEKLRIHVETITATEVAHGCGQFYDGIMDEQLLHPKQKILDKAIAGAEKRKLSNQWAWDRANSAVDISPLVACTLAYWGHLKFAGKKDVSKSVHFSVNEIIRLCKAGRYGYMDLARLKSAGVLDENAIKQLHDAGIEVP